MYTYNQLFSYTKSGRLAAQSRRNMREMLTKVEEREVGQRLALLPYSRTGQYSSMRSANYTMINLSHHHVGFAYHIYRDRHGWTKSNVNAPEPGMRTSHKEESFEYRGSYKGWHGSNHVPTYRSFCRISDDQKMIGYCVGAINGSITAPRGYSWGDQNGLVLIHNQSSVEYHVDTDEIVDWDYGQKQVVLQRLRLNVQERKEQEKKRKEQQQRLEDFASVAGHVVVTLPLAMSFGNCRVGVSQFARSIKLNPDSKYTLRDIIKAYKKHKGNVSHHYQERFYSTCQALAARMTQKEVG